MSDSKIIIYMEKKVTAIVKRTKLQKILKQLRAGAFPKKRVIKERCEVTVTDNLITLKTPWAQFSLEAETMGTARASFPLNGAHDILATYKEASITITLLEDRVRFQNFNFSANTCFFEDDKILRSIVLPVNNSEGDILRLLDGRYTPEELKFNQLWTQAVSTEERFKSALYAAYLKLKPYGINNDELESFVKSKVYKLLN